MSDDVEKVSRQDKILSASQGFLWATIILTILLSVSGIFAVLIQIERANAALLDCIAPYGECYIKKAAALESNNIVHINAVTIYCRNTVDVLDVHAIESCMIKELAK